MIRNFEPRLYQQTILGTAANKNTLVVIPTGLGKTAVAFLLAAQRLHLYPNSKILMLAPTKPLCEQHVETFKKHLEISEDKIVLFTGSVKPEKRAEMWKDATIVISTPQGLENDAINNRVNLKEVSLIVFDECVVKGTLISLANGSKIKVEDIEDKIKYKQIYVDSLNEETGNIEPCKVTNFHKIKSNKDIIEILADKRKISVTTDHLFFSRRNNSVTWRKAKELDIGDEIAFLKTVKDNISRKILLKEKDILLQYSKKQQELQSQYKKSITLRKKYGYGSRRISKNNGDL